MFAHHLRMTLVVIAMLISGSGCAMFRGRESAETGEKKSWNPFAAPKSGYVNAELAVEEEAAPPDPKDPLSLKLKYAHWMEETGHTAEAQIHYKDVLNGRPKEVAAILGLARIDFRAGHIDDAEKGYRRALAIDAHSPPALSGLGQCQVSRQQWAEAVATLTEASKRLPNDKTIQHQLAIALVQSGDIATAQIHFTRSVGTAAGHYDTALILKDAGRLAEAEVQLVLALQTDPTLKDAELWLAELRQSQSGSAIQTAGGSQIAPKITQINYQEFFVNGTMSIEPGQKIADSSKGMIQTASGHSIANDSATP